MTLHLEHRGLVFDPRHRRHHFVTRDGRERRITYKTRSGSSQPLDVVHQEKFKSGELKQVWWHQAVRLRFEALLTLVWVGDRRDACGGGADGVLARSA
jgi:hypothetical protein